MQSPSYGSPIYAGIRASYCTKAIAETPSSRSPFAKLTPVKPPLPHDRRFTQRGRFILGPVVLALIIFAAVVILAPFIYSIWMVMQPWNNGGPL